MADKPAIDALVSGIHAQRQQFVLAVTGGGSGAIARLLAVPGGSGTLLEAIVPYSAESLADFLHARPEHFCSAATARSMAMAAFTRARQLQQLASSSGCSYRHQIPIICQTGWGARPAWQAIDPSAGRIVFMWPGNRRGRR